LCAKLLDQKLGGFVIVSPIPVARARHHLFLDLFAAYTRATSDDRDVVSEQQLHITSMGQAFAEWGLHGVEMLREKVSVLIIVDVLSFSTAVDVAVARGASVIPFPLGDLTAAREAASAAGAVLARARNSTDAGYSLSPSSLATIPGGTKLLLPSPNGSRLSLAGGSVPVLTGSLRNAKAVAAAARVIAGEGPVAVIPAGEHWPDCSLRPAVEDLLGGGAILDALDLLLSAEARVARDAFRGAGADLAAILRASISGQELIDRGFQEDVEFAAALDVSAVAPILRDGAYQAWTL
jgi:2-phosphosulfolactate phosphatase